MNTEKTKNKIKTEMHTHKIKGVAGKDVNLIITN